MKFVVVFAAVLAAASAQYNTIFPSPQPPRPSRFPLPSPSPLPLVRPSAIPVVNRVSDDRNAEVLRYVNDIGPDGSFSYGFDTSNGISAEAQGVPRDLGGNPPVVPVVISGRYSHTSPEGVPVSISYIADENGYQPQGDAIPTPHPIPEAILRALDYLARNAPPSQK